uniref:Uncharacterized protein n=1 Tax=Ciona savignyi TaxID=51511 RepID=H2Z7M7_CIOSA
MSKNKEEFSNIVHENYALLKEIKQLADHEKTMLGIEKSYFEVPHVDDALRIAQLQIKPSGPVIQLTKFERGKGLLPLPRELATVMSQSPVFCYTHLLPTSAGMKNNGEFMRKIFTPPEDNLLCLGLTQMQGHLHPMYNLIHQYMLPTKHPEQLKCRVSNATYGHYGPNNPIYVYQRTGVVPPSPVICDPDVGPGTDAPNHFAVKLRQVPDWLHALQHENDPKFVPKREKVKPSPKKVKQIIKSRSVVSLNNGLMIGTSKTPTAIILPT